MANDTLLPNAPNTNYGDGANWVGGVAPANSDTVAIGSLPQGGPIPITATGVAITGQQITLSGTGGFGAAGGSSFDTTTTLTGTTDSNNASFDGTFTNAGTITDVSLALTSSGNAVPQFNNTGTISYDRAPIQNSSFNIGTGNASTVFSNTGTINVSYSTQNFPTQLNLGSPLTGSGTVNITGLNPNSTAPATGNQASLISQFGNPISGTNTFNLNDGKLELLSPSSGTVNFQDSSGIIDLGSGANATAGLTMTGYHAGDVIGLGTSTVQPGSLSYNNTTNNLSFTDSSTNAVDTLHIVPTGTQTYTTASFSEATGVGDFTQDQSIVTTALAPCYCPGTHIRAVRGGAEVDVAVENLVVGDLVVTSSGERRPVRWLGHRTVDCSHHPDPLTVQPIRIAADAFGPGQPARDLRVSPGHSVAVDLMGEVLVPASALANGATVVRENVDAVTYWHVELDSHDLLLAENLPAESYLDMGNRAFFAGSSVVDLAAAPDAHSPDPALRTHAAFCRPFHDGGPLVAFLHGRLLARAQALGWQVAHDPWAGVYLLVDGVRTEGEKRGLSARFALPAGAQEVWLVSDTGVPQERGESSDTRRLGLHVTGLRLDDGWCEPRRIALDDPLLCVGFHPVEDEVGTLMRWTAGRARLPSALWAACDGPVRLRLDLSLTCPALPQWVAPAKTKAVPGLHVALVAA